LLFKFFNLCLPSSGADYFDRSSQQEGPQQIGLETAKTNHQAVASRNLHVMPMEVATCSHQAGADKEFSESNFLKQG
jgi:hypothetical protein